MDESTWIAPRRRGGRELGRRARDPSTPAHRTAESKWRRRGNDAIGRPPRLAAEQSFAPSRRRRAARGLGTRRAPPLATIPFASRYNPRMSGITCHVLDTSIGRPAAGMLVKLERRDGHGWQSLGQAVT